MNLSQPRVLIIGGGMAGMAAACTLDRSGIGVHLVDRQDQLGGHGFQWACMATDHCRNCGACLSAELADQIQNRSRVKVHLNTTVERAQKKEGLIQVDLSGRSQESFDVAAVLLATGFAPFDPARISELGYGIYDRVISTADLNSVFKQESLEQLLPDIPKPSIAFIQCVGSRNRKLGRDYCSQVCCKTTVRQAEKILHLKPEALVTIFHMDLQIIGKAFRTQAAELASKVVLRQGVAAKVLNHLEEKKLSILYEDSASGARTAAHFDLIVLAVGIEPPAGIPALAELAIQHDEWGFVAAGEQTPAGIYAAGCAGGPMDIVSAREQGVAAAHRIAGDLGVGLPSGKGRTVAVLGGTREAWELVRTLAEAQYSVLMLDPGGSEADHGSGIDYFGAAGLERVQGTIGNFQLTFNAQGIIHQAKAAAIVVAVGADELPPRLPPGNVQSMTAFAREFEANPAGQAEPIVFWLDRQGSEWKAQSRRCLEMALDLRRLGKSVIVMMQKMLVHGSTGQRLYDQARHAGVRFLRVRDADAVAVTASEEGIHLELAEATLPGVPIGVDCQQLVLADEIRPSALAARVAKITGQDLDVEGFIQSVNVRHRPISSPRRGIFFIGACHEETDFADIKSEISSLKASLDMLLDEKGRLDDPARIEEGECVRCLTCLRICPHCAVVLKDGFQPVIDHAACFGCGICVSSCPARAIKPAVAGSAASPITRTVVFACQRSAFLAAKEAGLTEGTAITTIVSVPCAGRLDQAAVMQPLLDGADNVIVTGCYEGNCRSMIGSRKAKVLAGQLSAALPDLGQAVGHYGIAANEPQKMIRIVSHADSQEENSHA